MVIESNGAWLQEVEEKAHEMLGETEYLQARVDDWRLRYGVESDKCSVNSQASLASQVKTEEQALQKVRDEDKVAKRADWLGRQTPVTWQGRDRRHDVIRRMEMALLSVFVILCSFFLSSLFSLRRVLMRLVESSEYRCRVGA